MKQLIKLVLGTMLVIGLVSCNIETQRSYAGDLTIEVIGLPDGVAEVALFCNLNDWKAEEVNGTGFVRPVSDGRVVFDPNNTPGLKGYIFSEELQCQFVPSTAEGTVYDSGWWSKAISGSSEYANAKNNLVYNFASRGASDPMTLTLNVSGNASKIMSERVHYKDFKTAIQKTK